jgi:hypothetical protein
MKEGGDTSIFVAFGSTNQVTKKEEASPDVYSPASR